MAACLSPAGKLCAQPAYAGPSRTYSRTYAQ